MTSLRQDLLTAPNAITLGRIVLVYACIGGWLLGYQVVALSFGFFAGIGDYLDGWLARRLGQSSDLGATLDQLSDLIFESSAILFAVHLGAFSFWVGPVYLAREFVVTCSRSLAASRGLTIPSRIWGKVKTNFLHYAILVVFVALADVTPPSVDAILMPLAQFGLYAGLLLSWVSGGMYLAELVRLYDRPSES